MITSLQTNPELIRQVLEARRQPGFTHPCEGFRVVPAPARRRKAGAL